MFTQVVVYLGPAHSGKTQAMLRQYRDALGQAAGVPRADSRPQRGTSGLERALWLTPNARTAGLVRRQLLAGGLDACLEPGVVTFEGLTTAILAGAAPRRRSIGRELQRELLRRVVRSAVDRGSLPHFAAAAERAGLIDLLATHIEELQRRNVSPADYHQARPAHVGVEQHGELARLYADYTGQLTDHDLADIESGHAAARDALAADRCPRFTDLELVVVDGFTDFTRTQHDMLRQLARRAKRLLISLPDESPNVRTELFAKTAVTLDELRRHHPRLELERFAARPTAWPALDHLARHVFGNPAAVGAPPPDVLESVDRIEIVEAAGVQDEIVEIARRVKRRLASGAARPGEICVVFRSLANVAPRVSEAFDEFGIPYYLESAPRLASAPIVRTLLALLRLDVEDWPFRRLVSTLTNHTLTALDAESRRAADWLVRELQIAQGRGILLERVDQLAADADQPNQADYARRRATMAQQAQPALHRLAGALDELPQQATPTEWTAALVDSASALGLLHHPDAADGPTAEALDRIAWQALERHFAALERLDSWLGQPTRAWSRRDLIKVLVDVATHESLPRDRDEVGRVRVLAAPAARNISVRHLFLAGMSEQAFPLPEPAGQLATQADYRFAALVAAQNAWQAQRLGDGRGAIAPAPPASPTQRVPPAEFASRSQEEMLLFYEVLSRAEDSLTISYPALDDKAQTLPPSPYVVEIERLLGDALKLVRRSSPQLSPIPRDATISSPADWRLQAVAKACDGDMRLLAGLLSHPPGAEGSGGRHPLPAALDAGIRIVDVRARGDSFGPAEGLLTSPAVAARLAQRFGRQHLWSPSQWETYAACPYKFFLEGVLCLEPLADLVLETDFARRGSRLHHVLATFHRQWPAVRGERPLETGEERTAFFDYLAKVIDERITAPRGGIDTALLELDRRQIRKWAENHFDHHRAYADAYAQDGGPLEPHRFEFRFGPPRSGDSDLDPESTRDAFILEIDGEPIRVTGQIDRIDVATIDGRTYFNVIDYKSGKKASLTREHIETGERLQLPIYVEAAQALVFGDGATPLAAGYWTMSSGFDGKGALASGLGAESGEPWQEMKTIVRRRVRQFVDAIRQGDFPVDSRDDKCTGYCEFSTVCRVTQIRNLKKKWTPEAEKAV